MIALADHEAGRHLGFVNPAIYAIAQGPAYHRAFHDVITGDNSVVTPAGVFAGYNAGSGWDSVPEPVPAPRQATRAFMIVVVRPRSASA